MTSLFRHRDGDLLATRPINIGRLQIHFNGLIALCVFLTCGMFVNLGFWQLDRAAEKRQLQADWQAAQAAEPVPYAGLSESAVTDGLPVELSGSFLDRQVAFLVLYQFHQGRPGYELISPFRVPGDEQLVLISRGWIGPGEQGELPLVPDVPGTQRVLARVHVPEVLPEAGTVTDTEWPLRVPRMNTEQAARLLGEPVYPHVLRLEAEQAGVLARHWTAPSFTTRTHYAYAAQWFFFTFVVVVSTLLLGTNIISLVRQKKAV